MNTTEEQNKSPHPGWEITAKMLSNMEEKDKERKDKLDKWAEQKAESLHKKLLDIVVEVCKTMPPVGQLTQAQKVAIACLSGVPFDILKFDKEIMVVPRHRFEIIMKDGKYTCVAQQTPWHEILKGALHHG